MVRTDEIIRVGLVGYGFAGRTFHAPLIHTVPGLELAVIGSSRAHEAGQAFPRAEIVSPREVATHTKVDLVVVATPNDSHYPIAASALRSGKDVVIDKPFTVTLSEARSLLQMAKEEGQLLSVFHNRRWDSEILATKAVLSSGMLGDVRHYECHMDRYRPAVRNRWRENHGPGAGLWFDLGPHLIDQALHLFGLPMSVMANFEIFRDGGQTDDWAHVQLHYERLRVILHASLLVAGGGPRTIIHGTKGSWSKYGADVQEGQLIRGMLPGTPGFGIDSDRGVFYSGATGEKIETPTPPGDQRKYYEGIRDAILKRQSPPVLARDALATMAILEASFTSGREGHVVTVPLTAQEQRDWC